MPAVEGAGVELAYEESGDGPPLLLVHGMAADRAAWSAAAEAFGDRARVVAYDRRGYGGSGAPDPYERTTVAEQAEDLVALARRAGLRGAVACGVDFGALVVLDVLKRHSGVLRAAALVEPPVFQLVPEAMEPLAAERLALEDALRAGGRERAVEVWLASRGIADPGRLERARRDAAGFFADYGGLATLPLSRRDLRAIAEPVVVLDAPPPRVAPRHAIAAADAVARLLANAARRPSGELHGALADLLTG